MRIMKTTKTKDLNFEIPQKPKLVYAVGESKMVSWRLSTNLLDALKEIAEQKGYNLTEVVTLVLDQFCQQEQKNTK